MGTEREIWGLYFSDAQPECVTPFAVRIRLLLKIAGRRFGLSCVGIKSGAKDTNPPKIDNIEGVSDGGASH